MAVIPASDYTRASVGPASVVLSSAQTGNGDSTDTLDRGGLTGIGYLAIVSTVGATPTVTIDIVGSVDGADFFSVPYSLVSTPEAVAVAALTVTTATTTRVILRANSPWRYLKLVYSANTNVTLTATAYVDV